MVGQGWVQGQAAAQPFTPQDHDVPEDKILSLPMAEMGVHSVAYAFPVLESSPQQ